MADLSGFPITSRWPAQDPERLQLYSLPTPNGVKVSIMLEEIGLPYEPTRGHRSKRELDARVPVAQPKRKDPRHPGSARTGRPAVRPVRVRGDPALPGREDGRLLPADPALRYETIQWVFFQMAAVGPMFGQVGYFHKFAGREIEDKRPLERYRAKSQRLLGVLETRLEGRAWIMGEDYSIADIALLGWVRNLIGFYEARDIVGYDSLERVPAWLERALARPAVQRGLTIPKRAGIERRPRPCRSSAIYNVRIGPHMLGWGRRQDAALRDRGPRASVVALEDISADRSESPGQEPQGRGRNAALGGAVLLGMRGRIDMALLLGGFGAWALGWNALSLPGPWRKFQRRRAGSPASARP